MAGWILLEEVTQTWLSPMEAATVAKVVPFPYRSFGRDLHTVSDTGAL